MRLPSVRFTVRRMMITVAVVALWLIPITFMERQHRFRRLAQYHRDAGGGPFFISLLSPEGEAYLNELGRKASLLSPERLKWHRELADKYGQAAARPWLPVSPDPPPPES
jgi:hypothetical protein